MRLIDADALEPDTDYDDGEYWAYSLAQVRNAPTIHQESVQQEIVRCKDCKHGSPNGRYGCKVYHYKKYETHDMKPDDFCSFAERRTDEQGD